MYAIRQYEFGAADTLRYQEVADPEPGPGQVRIAVEAAGVHLIDTSIRRGVAGGPFPLPELPMTPGREVAGGVFGPGVDPGWLGRRVVAHLGQASGGYATLAVAQEEKLHEIGDLAAEVAVAMIGTGRTATAIREVTPIGARIMQRPGGMRELEASALAAAAADRWRPLVTPFALADAAGARAVLERRRTVGKTVLLP